LFGFAFAKHEGERGYYALCDTKIFSPKEEGSFYLVPNDEYTEIWFLLSNNSKAKIGFCRKHAQQVDKRLTEKLKKRIMDGVRRGWEKEFETNRWTEEQIKQYKETFFKIEIIRRLENEEITDK